MPSVNVAIKITTNVARAAVHAAAFRAAAFRATVHDQLAGHLFICLSVTRNLPEARSRDDDRDVNTSDCENHRLFITLRSTQKIFWSEKPHRTGEI